MTRPPLSRSDYIQAGHEKGLEFIGQITPASVMEKTSWRCLNKGCGKTMRKSYRAVKYHKNGCTCQNSITLKAADYEACASDLGIGWVGPNAPRNSKAPTVWIGKNGQRVEASYHQLAYDKIATELARLLGLVETEKEMT